jgi:multidrug efflux pump
MGAGANARHSIGTGIIGGMIGETTLAMLYVPLLFYLFETFGERGKEKAAAPAPVPTPGGAHEGAAPAGGRKEG